LIDGCAAVQALRPTTRSLFGGAAIRAVHRPAPPVLMRPATSMYAIHHVMAVRGKTVVIGQLSTFHRFEARLGARAFAARSSWGEFLRNFYVFSW